MWNVFDMFIWYFSEATGLEDQFHKDCSYVDTLVDQEKLDNLFNPQISLLPPDLQRQIEINWVTKGHTKEKWVFNNVANNYITWRRSNGCWGKPSHREGSVLWEMISLWQLK